MNETKKMSLRKYIQSVGLASKKILFDAMSKVSGRVEPKEKEKQPWRFPFKASGALSDPKGVQHITFVDKEELRESTNLRKLREKWLKG